MYAALQVLTNHLSQLQVLTNHLSQVHRCPQNLIIKTNTITHALREVQLRLSWLAEEVDDITMDTTIGNTVKNIILSGPKPSELLAKAPGRPAAENHGLTSMGKTTWYQRSHHRSCDRKCPSNALAPPGGVPKISCRLR